MLKYAWLILAIMTTLNCTGHRENSLRTVHDVDLREDAFERARALYQMHEYRAALRTLEKIITMSPLDELSVDAVVFAAEISIIQKNPEKGLEMLQDLEKRGKGRIQDSGRFTKTREMLSKAISRADTAPVAPLQATPEVPAPASVPKIASEQIEKVVGVLLPLSGHLEIYGNRALSAMLLAFNASEEQRLDGARILRNAEGLTAVIMDTMGNAEVAKQNVNRLVDEFHARVIIGDILVDTAVAIAQQAKERNVINLSLSRKDGLTAIGPNIFRLGVTPKKQARELLMDSDDQQEKKRYAILYPENGFGVEMRDAFLAEAKLRGCPVVKVQGYKPDETTFTSHIRQLVGPKRTAGNSMYEACTERANRIKDMAARRKAEKDCLEAVVPSIGFDALFIPEFPKALSYIVPALIAEGVMVSQNDDLVRAYRHSSHVSDAMPVQLLGPSSWNNASIGEKLGVQVDGAFFVDSGDLQDEREDVKLFVNAFTTAVQSAPALSEAYAYDAMRLIRKVFGLVKNENPPNLDGISHSLLTTNVDGVIGKISFDQERELVVPFRKFSFREGKIVPKS